MQPELAVLRVVALSLVLSACAASRAHALDVPPLRAHVNDYAHVLSPDHAQALENRLIAHQQQTGQVFTLLTVDSLEGTDVDEFGIRVAEQWKLSQKGKDEGLIMIVAPNEHKMRIEVGYGLEGVIPDAIAERVRRESRRVDDYPGAIDDAFAALIRVGGGDPEAAQETRVRKQRPLGHFGPLLPLLILLFLSKLLGGRRRRGLGGFATGALLGSAMRGGYGGGGWGGGGGDWGGGGGGGDWSGGSGGFGGGGASGDW